MPSHALVRKNISAPANRKDKRTEPSKKIYLLIAPVIYFIALTFLSLIFAAFSANVADPSAYTGMLALCANAIAAFISAFILSKRYDGSAIICAAYLFFVTCSISVIVSLILGSNDTPIYKALLTRLPLLTASIIGAFLGKAKKTDRSKNNRHRRKY